MIIHYNINDVLINLRSDLRKNDFLKQVGAKRSLHLETFSSVFDGIYSGLIDIEKEYHRFFSEEYDSFEEYLYRKFSLTKNEVDYIIDSNRKDDGIRFFRRAYGFYGYKSILDYLGDDDKEGNILYKKVLNMLSKDVDKVLKFKISKNENKN